MRQASEWPPRGSGSTNGDPIRLDGTSSRIPLSIFDSEHTMVMDVRFSSRRSPCTKKSGASTQTAALRWLRSVLRGRLRSCA